MSDVTILRADRWLDVVAGEVRERAVIVIDGNQIVGVNPAELPTTATEVDLGDVTLLPGLMDMELNMLIGGPGGPDGLPDPMHGYFVHSYHLCCADAGHRLATVDYGGAITAVVGRDNLIGTQFHPEKSQAAGLQLIANFLGWRP